MLSKRISFLSLQSDSSKESELLLSVNPVLRQILVVLALVVLAVWKQLWGKIFQKPDNKRMVLFKMGFNFILEKL